jgi:hypothetical protein
MAGIIDIIVGVNTSAVATGVQTIRAQINTLKADAARSFTSMFAFGSIVAGITSVVRKFDELDEIARRFDLSAESLQRLGNAAKNNGASLEGVARFMNAMTIRAAEAINGNADLQASFARLGISVADLRSLSPEALFLKIADSVRAASDQGTAYADVVKVAGRSAGELINTLRLGSAEITRLGDSMGVLDEKSVTFLSNAADEVTSFFNQMSTLVAKILVIVKDALATLTLVTATHIYVMLKQVENFVLAVKQLLSGDVKGAVQDFFNRFNQIFIDAAKKSKNEFDKIWSAPIPTPSPQKSRFLLDDEDVYAKREASARNEESLRKRLNQLERENALERLSIEERIASLKAEQLEMQQKAEAASSEEERLNAAIRVQEIEKSLANLLADKERTEKAMAERELRERERAEREAENEAKVKAERLVELRKRLQEAADRNEFSSLESIAEKREFLEKKRAQLVKELEEIAADNEEERLRKLIEMADLENEYTRLKDNSRKSDFTTPAADQLAKIGGGGNVALTGGFDLLSENRRQTDYLKSIDAQLRKGGTLVMR